MSLKTHTIQEGATLSQTGGTSASYEELPSTGAGVLVGKMTETDATIRPTSLFTARQATYNASTGEYSKGKRTARHRRPIKVASGKTVFPFISVEIEDHPEMTAAQKQQLWDWLGQLCLDSEFANFRNNGSLS